MQQIEKLVRDNIPDIIQKSGKNAVTKILNNKEFLKALDNKFIEEQQEFLNEHSPEELADVLEIIHTYCSSLNISFEELESLRVEKLKRNGGFKKKIFLEKVDKD